MMRVFRQCAWHGGMAEGPVLIRRMESVRGAVRAMYACSRCVDDYQLKAAGAEKRFLLLRPPVWATDPYADGHDGYGGYGTHDGYSGYGRHDGYGG